MKFNNFNKSNLKNFRVLFEAKMKELEAETGVSVQLKNINFQEFSFTSKVEAIISDQKTNVKDSEFAEHAYKFGLSPDINGKTFFHNGNTYRINGIAPRARKYPVLAINEDNGKSYKFSADMINILLK